MRCDRSLDDIMREQYPRRALSSAAREAAGALLAGRQALLVAPEPGERELPWRLAAAAGLLPLLVITPPHRDLQRRAQALADELDLIACHLDARFTSERVEALAKQLACGRWDAAFVSGRSLADPRLMAAARAFRPRLLVIEDAHRASVHGYRHDLAWLHAADLARAAGSVLALSDLASAPAREEIIARLGLRDCTVAFSGLDRPDLRIEARLAINPPQKDALLLGLFAEPPERAVVHVSERVEAERIAELIRDERGFSAMDMTDLTPREFGAALRRFREGGLRVLVITGALDAGEDWPTITVAATVGLPESLELLHRQMRIATGEGGRGVLIYEREEWPRLERAAATAVFDSGWLLGLYEAAVNGERLSFVELSRRTGLHPDDVNLGIEALIQGGALEPLARGDDWLRAGPGEGSVSGSLEHWGGHADDIRRSRLQRAALVPEFVLTRRCRRRALAEALDYPLAAGKCRCDRCLTQEPARISARIPGGYPIKTGGFRGWALALYRRPGEETPAAGPAKLMERLKYAGCEASGRRLALMMNRRVRMSRTYRGCELIVPIPPSDAQAGDSAAGLLAREISRLSGIPLAEALTPTRERLPQKELSSLSEKRRNIARAFEVPDAELVADRLVLLVDDIFDSGATMQEAAETIRLAGASDVRLLTAVRTAFGWRRDT